MEKSLDDFLDILTPVTSLPENHNITTYLSNRKIPTDRWVDIFYTEDFFEILRRVSSRTYNIVLEQLMFPEGSLLPKENRIVTVTRKRNGTLHCFVGRSIGNYNIQTKYRSVSTDTKEALFYNIERIDPQKTVYICEGVFDAMQLDNAVAQCTIAGPETMISGGTYMKSLKNYKSSPYLDLPFDDIVFVFDNQLSFKPVNNSYKKLVEWGHKVFIWPKGLEKYKDINELIFGYTKEQIHDIITENTFSGDAAMKIIRSCDDESS